MALYAMGDLHLAFGSKEKTMDIFGDVWVGHEDKIRENCNCLLKDSDTFVITGDHSWGHNLSESEKDLEFIQELPGRKILLRGNHDMFWSVSRTGQLNKMFLGKLEFLQNNFYTYGEYALTGSKGYCYEGKDSLKHFLKIRNREVTRVRDSLEQARRAGFKKIILFLHYPPTSIGESDSPFTALAEEYGVSRVLYSHCHGEERFGDSIRGKKNNILYSLVSGDYLNFMPYKVLD